MGPDGRASYAGLDKDLTGQTIRMANIGGQPYEAMYDSIKLFEEKTGAKVEIVFLGDGFHGCFRQWSQRPLTRDFTAVLAAQFQCIQVRTPFRFQAQ